MARKRKRRSGGVEIGTGPARVKIYTVNRKDGYPMFSLCWREDGRRRTKHLACIDEARLIAQQVAAADFNRFLTGLDGLGPVSRNAIRRNLVAMFRFAKKQGYLHPDRKTAAEQSESFKVPDKGITIFTPDEMEKILLAAQARILPLLAIGGFAGIRTAEICKLD
jgi:integrase